ncbi:MAG: hypothetical protein HOW97_37010 [Catenulispora sp.]|nr:hypothetical protein [Catenulispora sp.]
MLIRRLRAAAAALALFAASMLSTMPATADAADVADAPDVVGTVGAVATDPVQTTPMQPAFPVMVDTCRGHGAYLGTGLHRVGGGQNLAVIEVCGDAAKHSVRKIVATYVKVDGARAEGLRLHWRWADAAGTVRGGGDDDRAAFGLDAQREVFFTWTYNHPVIAQDPGARCVVGVLSQAMTQYITEPVCP